MSALSNAVSKSSSNGAKKLNIHWFKSTDLRLHDNPGLMQCLEKNSMGGILPVYCFDKRSFKKETPFGHIKSDVRRAKFLLESVADLRKSLESKGCTGLWVELGTPEDMMQKLCSQETFQIKSVTCQEEIASEELSVCKKVKSILKKNQGTLAPVWGSSLYQPDDLPFYRGVDDMPDTFTPFRNKVESKCIIGSALAAPTKMEPLSPDIVQALKGNEKSGFNFMPTLEELGYEKDEIKAAEIDSRSVMQFKGGETTALARLKDYIWDKDLLKVYFETRNGMIGPDYSSKFAPWLALGCLSPRYIASQCAKYEELRVKNKSTYWLVFELLWRDFFRFFAMKHGNSIFQLDGTLGDQAHGSHPNSRRWSFDKRHFLAWKEGKTGYPLVDANMRELAASGFMSNRGRQNVASFLTIDMSLDWRYGADYFESVLLDYDVCSNWGNWCAAAGMTGGRLNRFNIAKQGKDYDLNGDYVKLWCPELKNVPPQYIHEPWKMSAEEQSTYGVKLGVDYPNRIPTVKFTPPQSSRGGGGGGNKGRGNKNRRSQGDKSRNNKRYANGQKEMKSLKEGAFRISG